MFRATHFDGNTYPNDIFCPTYVSVVVEKYELGDLNLIECDLRGKDEQEKKLKINAKNEKEFLYESA